MAVDSPAASVHVFRENANVCATNSIVVSVFAIIILSIIGGLFSVLSPPSSPSPLPS